MQRREVLRKDPYSKYKSTKFLITVGVIVSGIALRTLDYITGAELVSVLQIIIPAYYAGNVIASHSAFAQPVDSVADDTTDDKEKLRDDLKHGR